MSERPDFSINRKAVAWGLVPAALGLIVWLGLYWYDGGFGNASIDTSAVEADIESWVLEQTDTEVDADCPDEMTAEQGATNDCIVTGPEGYTLAVQIRWQNDAGEYVMQFAQ